MKARISSCIFFALFTLLGVMSASAQDSVRIGIVEGAGSQQSFADIELKYKPVTELLMTAMGKKSAKVFLSQDFLTISKRLANAEFDVVIIRPGTMTARAVRDAKYVPVVTAESSASAKFIVKGDSKLKTLKDIATVRVMMPDKEAAVSKLGRAELISAGMTPVADKVQYVRLQDVVTFSLENGMADVGVVNPAQAQQWESKGGRVIHSSRAMPGLSVIASPTVTPKDLAQLRDALIGLSKSPNGEPLLKVFGVKGFKTIDAAPYLELLKFIGE